MSRLDTAVLFFYAQAGYSYHPALQTEVNGRLLGAIGLAHAETWARTNGCWFDWEQDYEPADYQDNDGTWHTAPAMVCVMYQHAEDPADAPLVLASLSGIMESDNCAEQRAYRRVIQAELACEVAS